MAGRTHLSFGNITSGGRLIFGIGAGGSINGSLDPAVADIVRRELDAYGVDVVATSDAIAALDEALTITRRIRTDTEPFDFDGSFCTLWDAIGETPRRPVRRFSPSLRRVHVTWCWHPRWDRSPQAKPPSVGWLRKSSSRCSSSAGDCTRACAPITRAPGLRYRLRRSPAMPSVARRTPRLRG